MLFSGPHWLCPQVRSGRLLLLVHSPLPSDWTAILTVSSLAFQCWSVLAVSPCHMGVCCVSTPQYMSHIPLPSPLVLCCVLFSKHGSWGPICLTDLLYHPLDLSNSSSFWSHPVKAPPAPPPGAPLGSPLPRQSCKYWLPEGGLTSAYLPQQIQHLSPTVCLMHTA